MSLRVAGSIAAASLRTTEVSMAVATANIANSDTDGYTRKTAAQTSRNIAVPYATGVDVSSVTSVVDQYLLKTLVGTASDVGYTGTLSATLDLLQQRLGTTDGSGGTGIADAIDDLADSLATLATSPESDSAKAAVVDDAGAMAESLRDLSSTVQDLRAQTDEDIADTVDRINETLTTLDSLNDQIVRAKGLGQNTGDLEDQRNTALQTLAADIDVRYQTDGNGRMRISTSGGTALLDSAVHSLSYTPAASVSVDTVYSATGTSGFSAISVGGKDITGSLTAGTLAALVDLRDDALPNQQARLDELATTLKDALNAAANAGSTVPAPPSLTSAGVVSATDSLSGTGTLRLAVTNSDGTAADVTDIDLSGLSTVQDLMDAINATGTATAGLGSDGRLTIAATDTGMGIALGGDTRVGSDGVGLSAFFGFNDILTGGGAGDLRVSQTLLDDSSRLPTAVLSAAAGLGVGDTALTTGDATTATALGAVLSGTLPFDAAGGLSGRTASAAGYAADIIQGIATAASAADTAADSASAYADSLTTTFTSQSGVNVDEETATISSLQSAYESAAAVMEVLQEMFETALSMLK